MTAITSQNLSPIAILFQSAPLPSKLCLTEENGVVKASLAPLSFKERFIYHSPTAQDMQTLLLFKRIIGESRFARITEKPAIKAYGPNFILTKDLVEWIFLELAAPTFKDFEEAAQNLYKKNPANLTLAEADSLYRKIIPFERIEDAFVGNAPQIAYLDRVSTSGKGLAGLRERVKILLDTWDYHNNKDPFKPQKHFLYDAETLTSRLGDREPPEGTMIRRPEGFYRYEKTFTGQGGYYSLLRSISHPEQGALVCRGTAMRPNAEGGILSGINNLSLDPGIRAIEDNWPRIKEYLATSGIKRIDIYGKSQGGAHAQYLAPIIEKNIPTLHVRSLNTVASLGAGHATQLFLNVFTPRETSDPIKINIIRNSGALLEKKVDFVPFLGGDHVGKGRLSQVNTHLFNLCPVNSLGPLLGELKNLSFHEKMIHLRASFQEAHLRQTTLQSYVIQEISSDRKEIDLSIGNDLEAYRGFFAKAFHYLSLGMLNPHTYETFFQAAS